MGGAVLLQIETALVLLRPGTWLCLVKVWDLVPNQGLGMTLVRQKVKFWFKKNQIQYSNLIH